MGYISHDSIDTFSLHDGKILDIWFSRTSMFWQIEGAIISGLSCKETPSNSRNTGEDRYGEPYLEIEFQNFEVSSFLRGGYKCYQKNKLIAEYPSQFLFLDQYKEILEDIIRDKNNVIYSAKEIHQNPIMISIDFYGGTISQYYTLQFTTTKLISSWQTFGDEARYLKWCREKNK